MAASTVIAAHWPPGRIAPSGVVTFQWPRVLSAARAPGGARPWVRAMAVVAKPSFSATSVAGSTFATSAVNTAAVCHPERSEGSGVFPSRADPSLRSG